MAANINDKFSEVSTGTRPNVTTVASVRSASGSSLVCDDLTGWATDTAVHFVTYEIDGQGNVVPGTQQDMKGIVSGNTIGNIVVTGGTDIGNKVGDIVQQLPTAAWAKDLADGLQVSHNLDGSLKAGIVDTTELADESVTTGKLDDAAVTNAKINLSTSTNDVWTILNLGGLKIIWTETASRSVSTGAGEVTTSIPAGLLSTVLHAQATPSGLVGEGRVMASITSISVSQVKINLSTPAGSGTAKAQVLIIGT